MMQRHYRADGWLGMLLGSKLYINFDGKFTFEHAYAMLLKELKDRGRISGSGGTMLKRFAVMISEIFLVTRVSFSANSYCS